MKNFKSSLGSKYSHISEFFINLQVNLKCTIESLLRQNSKKRVMNNVVKLYDNYFNSDEETNDEGDLNEKEGNDPKQFKITRMGDNKLPE